MPFLLSSLPIDNLTFSEASQRILKFLENSQQHYVITLNPEIVLMAQKNTALADIIKQAGLVLSDGIGIVWAARLLTKRKIQRIPGVELLEKLAELLSAKPYQLILLGGGKAIAEKVTKVLKQKYSTLDVSGFGGELNVNYDGTFKDQNSAELWKKIKDQIQESNKPTLLAVAFGAPKQEFWINQYLPELPNVKVAIGVGGALDIIAGKLPRAPKLMRSLGLEWLWRLFLEPKRIVRIGKIFFQFIPLVLSLWFKKKFLLKQE